jgi:LuxR family maltose regulon positive regulatory protein
MQEPHTLARSRVLLAQGKPDQALDLLIRLGEAAQEGDRVGSLIEILAIQALAWWSRNDLPRAITALEKGLLLAQPEGYVRLFVDEGAPMAELLQKLGAQIRLQASRSGGRTLEYIDQLLSALGSGELVAPPAGGPQPFIEPLSDRELEVLRLLAEGLSNREITQRLTVAIGTVKAHVHNIYGKLGVENRIQAIARARELGLL